MKRSIPFGMYSSFEEKRIVLQDVRSHSEAVCAPSLRLLSAKRSSEQRRSRYLGFPVCANG